MGVGTGNGPLVIWREHWVRESVMDVFDDLPYMPRTKMAERTATPQQLAWASLVLWDGEALRLGWQRGEQPVSGGRQLVLVDLMLPGFCVEHTYMAAREIGAATLPWHSEARYRAGCSAPQRLAAAIDQSFIGEPLPVLVAA